jgi:signal transduction histidine kinase
VSMRVPVLNVDDYPPARHARTSVLRRAGFAVREATTGTEALQAVTVEPLALVLLDVHLPDMSGFEVCRRIKTDPTTAAIPVLHLSSMYVEPSDTARGLEGGADAYLIEPVDPAVLVASVNALLRLRRAEEALREAVGSERRARAEAEAANRAKDEFLATLSHELRAPLTALLGWARMLRAGRLDAAATARGLAAIDRSARVQAQLIDDLLDVSRIVTGKLGLDLRPVRLAAVVEAAVDLVRAAAHGKGLELQSTVDASLGLRADPDRLQQAVWNLLTNAVKFTPPGGRIDVRLARAGSAAQITVSDTGQGIAPGFLPYVFDRFRQADSSSRRPNAGLGLGLAIARELVELHAGTIRAESAGVGQGATFVVALPLATGDVERGAAASPAALETPPDLGDTAPDVAGLEVMVVEDDADTRELLVALLEHGGARVASAASVTAALSLLDGAVPDVLVSDLAMPDEDGYDLIRAVRARPRERGGRVPAIALTGHARREDRQHALAAGYDAHVAKPVEPVTLVQLVARLARSLDAGPFAPGD